MSETLTWYGDDWELRQSVGAEACYAEHAHDTFSIGQVLTGRSRCRIGRQETAMAPGSVAWIRSHQLHQCNPLPGETWSYRMLYIGKGLLGRLGLSETSSGAAHGNAGLGGAYDRFVALATAGRSPEAIDDALGALLGQLGPAHHEARVSAGLRAAYDHLKSRPFEPLVLDDLSRLSGLSPWQLLRGFRRLTGMTPHALQMSLRLDGGRRWLRQGNSLADTAFACGFADQSHFTRMFKRHSAMTPGTYRRSLRHRA